MRRMLLFVRLVAVLLVPVLARAQDFPQQASPIPARSIDFRLTTPVYDLRYARYAPSLSAVPLGNVTIRFFTRPSATQFLWVRWDLDASDGVTLGDWYKDISQPAVVNAAYDSPGTKTITVHLRLFNELGQSVEDTKTIEIVVVPGASARYVDAHGNALTYWQGGDGVYDRPVLVVEGFDPENEQDGFAQYAAGFALAETARAAGYDLLFLDFADGGASVTANKDVFLGACAFAHEKLAGREASVQVVALSMGGMVARYGLAYAEDQTFRGNRREHYVNTFIAYDAPLQGVHLNRALQDLLHERGSATQQHTLQSPAARELLYDDTYGSSHDDLMNAVQRLTSADGRRSDGYPGQCRNLTLSNGTRRPVYADKTPGVDLLATLDVYTSLTIGFVSFDFLAPDLRFPVPAEQRDLWPGATFPHDLTTINTMAVTYRSPVPFPFSLLLSGYGDAVFRVNFNPSYQPTEAALDLTGYLRLPDGTLAGGNSRFDDTLTQAVAHRHEEVTDVSRRAILRWLDENRTYAYLSSPRDVRAVVTEENAVLLTFDDASANNDNVTVERRPEGGTWAVAGTAPASASSYADRDPALTPFARYGYRLRSVSGDRSSTYSPEVTVLYQPHLAASGAAALGAGGQRRALQTTATTNNRFLAYESAGGAYLVRFINSDADAGSWERERPIGGPPVPGVESRSPSLFPDSTGAAPRVIYEEVNTATGSHAIRHAVFSDAAQALATYAAPLATFSASASFLSTPVAMMTDAVPNKPAPLLAAAWGTEGGSLVLGLGVHAGLDAFPFSSVDLSSGVLAAPVVFASNPSIAAILNAAGNPSAYHVFLAWEEQDRGASYGGIRLLHGRYTPSAQPWPPAAAQLIWESTTPFSVAQNSATETHRRPSLVVDGAGNLVIAWESSSGTSGKILLQKRSWLTAAVVTSATATIATGSGAAAPRGVSLADKRGVPGSGGDLIAAWTSDAGGASAAWYVAASGAWSAPRLLDGSARQVALASAKGPSAERRVVAYTGAAGPPYEIRGVSAGLLPPAPAPTKLSWGPVLVNGVKRPQLFWTAVGPDVVSYAVRMYTCPATGVDCGAGAFHALQVTTAGLTWTDLNTTVFTKTATDLFADLTNYYEVTARDRFNQSGAASNRVAVNTEENYTWKEGVRNDAPPRAYRLGENYPNPFNPATTIPYELPAPGEVRLVVYDLLGEERAVVAEGRKEAGRYTATWSAGGVPSGVYVAVFRVTGTGGALLHASARKLMLLR